MIAQAVLQTFEKITQNLIFAFAVVLVPGLAKQRGQFMLAERQTGFLQKVQHVVGLQIQGNAQLHQHHVVCQAILRYRLWAFATPATGIDQSIQKNRHLAVGDFDKSRIVLLLQPGTHLIPAHVTVSAGKYINHLVIIQIKDIADTPEYIVKNHKMLSAISIKVFARGIIRCMGTLCIKNTVHIKKRRHRGGIAVFFHRTRASDIEAVQLHHLGPCSDEVLDKLFFSVIDGVELCYCTQLGV